MEIRNKGEGGFSAHKAKKCGKSLKTIMWVVVIVVILILTTWMTTFIKAELNYSDTDWQSAWKVY